MAESDGGRPGELDIDALEPLPIVQVLDEAGRRMRAPWAASLAGVLFALLFTGALVLLRNQPILTATNPVAMSQAYAEGQYTLGIIGGLYLAPFAGIMFLWFVAVIRDQIGEREDHFFATVFFGSGLLFVALLFAASAAASEPIVAVQYLGLGPSDVVIVGTMRALAYTLLFAFSTRAAAVFLISMATLGLRSRAFPRWIAWTGYVVALILLVAVTFFDWIILAFPAWVAVVSVSTFRRERLRHLADVQHARGVMPL